VKPALLKSDALLLLTAAIWGFAFVAQRVGMQHVGPFTFNAVRFALGSCSLVVLLAARRSVPGNRAMGGPGRGAKATLPGGVLAGLVLYLGASLQQVGIVYTTAGKAGFITGLYVVVVPLLGLFWRQRPGLGAWAGALIAAVGLYFLSVRGGFSIALGDSLVLGGAFFWAVHVLIIGWLTSRIDAIELALTQFATCFILSLATAIIAESPTTAGLRGATIPILYGGLMSVGMAYTLQVVAQKDAHPAHAAILLSLEALFAALGGWIILSETLSVRDMAGCGLMLSGVLLSILSRRTEFRGGRVRTIAT
jgi:drug/metabolite transporter (DMT)-like permease